jgi:hypothetical protein
LSDGFLPRLSVFHERRISHIFKKQCAHYRANEEVLVVFAGERDVAKHTLQALGKSMTCYSWYVVRTCKAAAAYCESCEACTYPERLVFTMSEKILLQELLANHTIPMASATNATKESSEVS